MLSAHLYRQLMLQYLLRCSFKQGLSDVAVKKKSEVKKTAFAAMQTELLEDTKLFTADSTEECQQVIELSMPGI